jgi:hypothetical protein
VNPDATGLLISFAIGIAGVIEEHGHGMAVNDDVTAANPEQIGQWAVLIPLVGFVLTEPGAVIFEHS